MNILLDSKDFYEQKALYIRVKSKMERGLEGGKRDLRERVSHVARSMYFTVSVTISDILQISMWM